MAQRSSNIPRPPLPEFLLNQIAEFSPGGFCVLFFGEQGMPEVISRFDTPAHMMAMTKFAEPYFQAENVCEAEHIRNCVEESHNPNASDESHVASEFDDDDDEGGGIAGETE
jgi:hypothetical protein